MLKNKNGAKTYSLYNSQGMLMSTYENNGYTDYYYLGAQLVAKYSDPNTQSDKPGYTGHIEDDDLQLTYMQQRYYDPLIGRFYSNDPVDAFGHMQRGNSIAHGFNRYAYANNNPYKYIDPDGEFGILGAAYGAISGGVGGFVASGGGFKNKLVGTLSGAAAGAAVGFVAPQTSHVAGMAVAGMAASAAGQALGSTATAAMEKGIENVTLDDINVDATTTVAGGLGAGGGGLVAKGVANMTMKPVVGQTMSQAGAPTSVGLVAGAVVEGAIIGTAEKVAPIIEEKINEMNQ